VTVIPRLAQVALGTYLAGEAFVAFGTRRWTRRAMFRRAAERAATVSLPLMVVGDPDTGFITKFFGRDYGCGDLCTDLTGCPACPSTLRGPLEQVLLRIPSRSHVVFECLTLEYVTDLPLVVRELERIAGPGNFFGVRIEPGSSTFTLFPGAHWEISSMRPWRFRALDPRRRPSP